MPLPDWIVANGAAARRLLQGSGYAADRVVNGGAFRFEHLHSMTTAQAPDADAIRRRTHVLVALSTVDVYSRALLRDVLELVRTPLLHPVSGTPVEFIVTCHQDLPLARLLDGVALPPGVSTATSAASEFSRAAVCLFAPPTGTWREALFAGVPTLKYTPDALDLDPVDSLASLPVTVCGRRTLRSALTEILRDPPVPDSQRRLAWLRDVFSPVDERAWLDVLAPARERQCTA
jgi:hypothetical protein